MSFPGTARITITPQKTVKVVIGRFRGQFTRAGIADIAINDQRVTVSFGTALPNANYVIQNSIFNSADDPDLNPFFVSKILYKGANGFIVMLNIPAPTANYKLHWSIAEQFNP